MLHKPYSAVIILLNPKRVQENLHVQEKKHIISIFFQTCVSKKIWLQLLYIFGVRDME